MGVDGEVKARAVFLDRDGVLNAAVVRDGRPYSPPSAEALELLPGVRAALDELKRAGFVLLVVTNQPDVGRGKQTREAVEGIHARLRTELPVDAIYSCYHDDADQCACRKPAPGLLLEGAREWGVDVGASFMVGDRWRDIEAGQNAGCKTVWIDRGYAEKQPQGQDFRAESLREAVEWILERATV